MERSLHENVHGSSSDVIQVKLLKSNKYFCAVRMKYFLQYEQLNNIKID